MMFTRVLFPVKNSPLGRKRLFVSTFNECCRQNQSKSIHKCFTVIVSNGPIDSSIVRQLDSPTLLHKIDKQWKLHTDLCCLKHFAQYIFFNVSSVNLKGNKRKFRNLTHIIFMLPIRMLDYRSVGLYIELSDQRSDPTSNQGTESAYIASSCQN